MEGATLTRRAGRVRSRAAASPTPRSSPGWRSALLCVGTAIGFFVYPTYPNYDSYYSLLWGREVLDLGTLPTSRASASRPSTRWRSSSARC